MTNRVQNSHTDTDSTETVVGESILQTLLPDNVGQTDVSTCRSYATLLRQLPDDVTVVTTVDDNEAVLQCRTDCITDELVACLTRHDHVQHVDWYKHESGQQRAAATLCDELHAVLHEHEHLFDTQ